jgi:xanthine dehydrogenase accessory factor
LAQCDPEFPPVRDLLNEYDALRAGSPAVGRAVVTSVWGSAPRPEGACLLATAAGAIAGSISGGCVESAAAQEIAAAIARGTPSLVTYGVTNEKAWEVGLACGGTIKVFVEPAVSGAVLAAARGTGGVIVATIIESDDPTVTVGSTATVGSNGSVQETPTVDWLDGSVREAALAAIRREACCAVTVTGPGGGALTVFLEVYPPRPRLVIFGGVHIAMALVPLAKSLGYYTIVADGRQAFVTADRFPEADERLVAWPEEAFARIAPDAATYVCVLSHDPKFDDPALELALRSPAPYIGAIGSRKTQAARRERLLRQGFSSQDVGRVRGPIGLDLGGRSPAETALGIMAEITMVRYAATGRSLASADA